MSQQIATKQAEPKGLFLQVRDYAEEKLLKKPTQFVGRYGVTPDRISLVRFPGALASLAVHNVHGIAGATLYLANGVLDWIDGASARHNPHLATKEGARFDSLIDKGNTAASYVYLAAQGADHPLFLTAAVANIAVDVASQMQRGDLVEQVRSGIAATLHPDEYKIENPESIEHMKANVLGKIKFILQTGAVSTMLAVGTDEATQIGASVGLLVAAGLGAMGLRKRKQKEEVPPPNNSVQ